MPITIASRSPFTMTAYSDLPDDNLPDICFRFFDEVIERWHDYRPILTRLRGELHKCVYASPPPAASLPGNSRDDATAPPEAPPSYFALVKILRRERARLLQQTKTQQVQLDTLQLELRRAQDLQRAADRSTVFAQHMRQLQLDLQVTRYDRVGEEETCVCVACVVMLLFCDNLVFGRAG